MPNAMRHVELDIDIGADAKDWSAVQATEKLKPVETELRRIEELVAEIVAEMEYLRGREQKLRDTNESTNNRVKWFAFGTMGMLVALGAWQIMYLRAYFRQAILKVTLRAFTDHVISDRSILSRMDTKWDKNAVWTWMTSNFVLVRSQDVGSKGHERAYAKAQSVVTKRSLWNILPIILPATSF